MNANTVVPRRTLGTLRRTSLSPSRARPRATKAPSAPSAQALSAQVDPALSSTSLSPVLCKKSCGAHSPPRFRYQTPLTAPVHRSVPRLAPTPGQFSILSCTAQPQASQRAVEIDLFSRVAPPPVGDRNVLSPPYDGRRTSGWRPYCWLGSGRPVSEVGVPPREELVQQDEVVQIDRRMLRISAISTLLRSQRASAALSLPAAAAAARSCGRALRAPPRCFSGRFPRGMATGARFAATFALCRGCGASILREHCYVACVAEQR